MKLLGEHVLGNRRRHFRIVGEGHGRGCATRGNRTEGGHITEHFGKGGLCLYSGRGKFADIIVRIEPVDEGFEGGLQFVDEVKGGNIPKEFIPSIQKGFTKSARDLPFPNPS